VCAPSYGDRTGTGRLGVSCVLFFLFVLEGREGREGERRKGRSLPALPRAYRVYAPVSHWVHHLFSLAIQRPVLNGLGEMGAAAFLVSGQVSNGPRHVENAGIA